MLWQNIDILTAEQAQRLDNYLDGLNGATPQCAQIVRVYWPEGTVNYSFKPLKDDPPFRSLSFEVEDRLLADNSKQPFLTIKRTAAIAPDIVNLKFIDKDKTIRRLMDKGENARCEIFLYFPVVDILVSEFVGQVKRPKKQRGPIYTVDVVAGVRPNLYPATTRLVYYTGCQAIYGGHLSTWEEISRNACKVNRHLPVLPAGVPVIGNLDPATGAVYADCPQNNKATCALISGKPEMYFGGEELQDVTTVGTGSKSTLAKPYNVQGTLDVELGVLFGHRKNIPLQLRHFVRQSPGSNSGSMVAIYWGMEGPIQQWGPLTFLGAAPQGSNVFNGDWAQPTTAYLQTQMGQDVGNFSNTAYVLVVKNPVNPSTITIQQLRDGGAIAEACGFSEVRQYDAAGNVQLGYYVNSAFAFLTWLTDLRFGLKLPLRDFVLGDWVKLDAWDKEIVQALGPDGQVYTTPRNNFHQFIVGRKAEEVVKDWQASMRFLTFIHGGKVRAVGVDRWDLGSVPSFRVRSEGGDVLAYTDGPFKNSPEIELLSKSADELPLVLKVTFDDEEKNVPGRPLLFQDTDAIVAKRKANQDAGWQAPQAQMSLYGITSYAQAVRASNFRLHLGELDTGGTRNNLGTRFVLNGVRPRTLNLHPGAVLHLDWDELDAELEPGFGEPFKYFRVLEHTRRPDLKTEINAWAYPKRYYECYGGNAVEAETAPPTAGADAVVLEGERV